MTMTTKEMITKLKTMGFKVEAYKRKDGGWLIKKINNTTFTGASGNKYAREILNVELSQARIEQTQYNVRKYIKGVKKPKEKIDQELTKSLEKVQRQWRKNKVQAKVTKRKLRWHLKEGGREEAKAYLEKMTRYGKGIAYEDNVKYLAQYVRDVAKGMEETDKELADASRQVADFIESKLATFKDEWIHPVYEYWYAVTQSGYNPNVCSQAIRSTYAKIG